MKLITVSLWEVTSLVSKTGLIWQGGGVEWGGGEEDGFFRTCPRCALIALIKDGSSRQPPPVCWLK